jgi:hypothetical protein
VRATDYTSAGGGGGGGAGRQGIVIFEF